MLLRPANAARRGLRGGKLKSGILLARTVAEDRAPPSERRLLLALVVVQVAFGGLATAGKYVLPHMPPLALALLRLATAAVVLVALERWAVRSPMPAPRELGLFALLALLGVTLNQGLFLVGLQWTTATNAVLLIATIPAFTLLVAVALRHERATMRRASGLAISFAGVALLVAGGTTWGSQELLGDLLIVANSLCYSAYLVLSRPALARHDPLTVIAWVFVFGFLEMLLVAWPTLDDVAWSAFTWETWTGLAYVLLAATVLTYGLNNWALRFVPASRVASFVYLQPLVGTLLAWVILDETLGWRTLAAGALILGGVALANTVSPSRRAGRPF